MKIKNTLKYLKSVLPRYIDLRVLKRIQSKFSTFADLLLRDQQHRKETVIAEPFPGLGPDIDPEVVRPWRKIPNVRNFRITLRPLDWIFLLFRFEKRSVPLLKFGSWKNAPRNQYIDYMFTRLRKQVEAKEYEKASETIGTLMNSTSYKIAGFNSVMRNWHRKYPLGQIEVWRDEIGRLIRERATKINYSRVYMQEPDKLRPLGVPTVPGRVYLHMYNNLLTEGRLVTETGKQHGYLPGRGVQTAGGALAKRLSSKNIYEADFKGFFDNVTHSGIMGVLESLGFPQSERDFVKDLNKSLVTLQEEDRLVEPERPLVTMTASLLEFVEVGALIPINAGVNRGFTVPDANGDPMPGRMVGVKVSDSPEVFEPYHALPDDVRSFSELDEGMVAEGWIKRIGVPQGAPTSCSVATLSLRPLEEKEEILLYADDILGFPSDSSREPSEILNSPDRGVLVKDKKTRWLKIDGKGIVESFKFLGIRYYPPRTHEVHIPLKWISYFKSSPLPWSWLNMLKYTVRLPERFEADTRKGAKLVFTRREAFLSYLYKSREILLLGGSAGKQFLNKPLSEWLAWNLSKFEKLRSAPKLLGNNSLTGWFTARMFCDSGDLKTKQDFTLTYHKDSWMAYRWPLYCLENDMEWEQISIFTASSFACDDLASMIDKPYKYKPKKKNRFRKVYPRSKPVREDTNLEPGQGAEQIARGMGRRLRCYGPNRRS